MRKKKSEEKEKNINNFSGNLLGCHFRSLASPLPFKLFLSLNNFLYQLKNTSCLLISPPTTFPLSLLLSISLSPLTLLLSLFIITSPNPLWVSLMCNYFSIYTPCWIISIFFLIHLFLPQQKMFHCLLILDLPKNVKHKKLHTDIVGN